MTVKIYLAGGTVTDWQRTVMDEFVRNEIADKVSFYNPADLEVGPIEYPEPTIYSPMNRKKIEECDIVFALLEASNPTPINVVLEIGYALGLGKMVIFCNEWTKDAFDMGYLKTLFTEKDDVKATWFKPHYLAQVLQWCQFVEKDFGIAIQLLRKLVEYEIPERSPVNF